MNLGKHNFFDLPQYLSPGFWNQKRNCNLNFKFFKELDLKGGSPFHLDVDPKPEPRFLKKIFFEK